VTGFTGRPFVLQSVVGRLTEATLTGANSVMTRSIPEFGVRVPDAAYVDRPGAYAIILGRDGRLAFVRGKAGRLFLPGGGVGPGEQPEDALLREILEEVGWTARILGAIGRATQLVFAEGEGYFAIRATYFRTALIKRRTTTRCEHEIVWLTAAAAANSLARESDAWAISRVCNWK
jgi:8-oxo-dGTP diphosphatase